MIVLTTTSIRPLWVRLFLSLFPIIGIAATPSEEDSCHREAVGIQPPDYVMRTEAGRSPEELVRNVFVDGTCDNISNIRGLGHEDGIGYFENGKASIGMERGIILSTGPVVHAGSSNTTGDKSGDFFDTESDPDLSRLATGQVRDRVGLEFDFVPLDSFVTFRYVFASEEYCEFVGSQYNDVFGFFVSGPGIEGGFTGNAENVALVPGSKDFVSINNINHKKNQSYYIGNTRKRDADRCGIEYERTPRERYIEYDGFTTQLTAVLKLRPCETYHIRLVIADIADNFYDSAVFLEAGSFDLGGQIEIRSGNPRGGAVSEGCSDAYFEFIRDTDQSTDYPVNVRFRLAPGTTAQEGVDFQPLVSEITIPAGQSSVRLPVQILQDGEAEGEEKIVLELDIPCACYTDTAQMVITEPPDLLLKLDDASICPEQSALLTPYVEGGNPDYSYRWSDQSTGSSLEVSQARQEPYYLTVTDACGQEATASVMVMDAVPPSAVLSGDEQVCEGDTALLRVDFTGLPPWRFTYSIDGEEMPAKTHIYENPYYLPTDQDGEYTLHSFSDSGCVGEVSGLGSVEVWKLPIGLEVDSVSCAGGSDGRISLSLPQEVGPYRYDWASLPSASAQQNGLPAGNYQVSIQDGRGCSHDLQIQVDEPLPITLPALDCELLEAGRWRLQARGGTPPYDYRFDNQSLAPDSVLSVLNPGQEYWLQIEDSRGCLYDADFLVPSTIRPMVRLPENARLGFGTSYRFEPELLIPESLVAGLRWRPADNLSCQDCLNPEMVELAEGTYTLTIIDRFGCTDEAEINIRLNIDYPVFVPNAFSPNGDGQNDHFGLQAHPAVVRMITRMAVYDRWGNHLYEAHDLAPDDPQTGWDGTVRGTAAPIGVYVYHIEVELSNGESRILRGDVMLVR